MNVVYVTGNANKARYFNELVGLDIAHKDVDTIEIQSLDTAEVVTAKAKEAFSQIGKPVIVEDTSFILPILGRLPGTFIKWFIEDIGLEGICRLADQDTVRAATATATFAYYDGTDVTLFTGTVKGTLPNHPTGNAGFGWNQIFIPEGFRQTLGEMDDATFKSVYTRIKPFATVRDFLKSLEVKS